MTEPDTATGRAWIELNLSALRHNVETLRSLLPPDCALMPAVKANAYGHGALPIAKELNNLGVDAFCVACAEEGAALRQAGVTGEILILGYTHPSQFSLLYQYDLSQTVVDTAYAEELARFSHPLKVHLAVDTGMHRLGIDRKQVIAAAELFTKTQLNISGIFTHLSASDGFDERSLRFTEQQVQYFRTFLTSLQQQGIFLPKTHLLASSGVLHYPTLGGAYARVGIALYGLCSSREEAAHYAVSLSPVLSLKARVASVRTLAPGESAGYAMVFTAQAPTSVAVLTIGYADGLPRCLGGRGTVLLHGKRAPIVGRICMDQTLVDVTEIPEVHPGDEAVLIGESGSESISAYDLAEQSNTITNEILSRLGFRLVRIAI